MSFRAQGNAPPDFAVRRSPGSCEKLSSLRLCLLARAPNQRARRLSGTRPQLSSVLPSACEERRFTSWPSPSQAPPSAWPQALLSSRLRKTSLPPLSLRAQPSWPVQSWQVQLFSLPALPRPLQLASWPELLLPWPAQPWPWQVPLWPWQALLSSLPVLPRLSRPASWPALLLPWPRRPSAWQQVPLSSQRLRLSPPLLLPVLSLLVTSLPVTWMPALWMTV